MKKSILFLFFILALAPKWVLADQAVEPSSEQNQIEVKEKVQEMLTPIPAKKDLMTSRKRENQLSRGSEQIYSLTMRSNVVYKIQTSIGYETTIHLPEPPLMVFVGDRELFKVETYGHVVTLKPITDYEDARTNLTIITPLSRLAFEITVGKPETADFALDFREKEQSALVENEFKKRIEEKERVLRDEYAKKESALDEKARTIADEKLKNDILKAAETKKLNESEEESGIKVELLSFSRIGEKSYLKFRVRNNSSAPYKVSKIVVGLETLKHTTLGLRTEGEGIIEFNSTVEINPNVLPKGYASGVVIFEGRVPAKNERPIFFVFEDGGARHVKIRGFEWKA